MLRGLIIRKPKKGARDVVTLQTCDCLRILKAREMT